MKLKELRKLIREEIETSVGSESDRYYNQYLTQTNPTNISPAKLADALVEAGLVKDEWTDLSGKKASSELGFKIKAILDSL